MLEFCQYALISEVTCNEINFVISPKKVEVGQTVKLTCKVSSKEKSFFVVINKLEDGVMEEVATNRFINDKFKETGRYEASTNLNNKDGTMETTVKITIKGEKLQ